MLPSEQKCGYTKLAVPPGELIEMYPEIVASEVSPYIIEHHFSPLGHRIAAEVIDREITRRLGSDWLETLAGDR